MKSNKIDICIPSLTEKDSAYYKEKASYLDAIGIPVNKVIVSTKKGLASARNDLISRVTTDWFLFLDDDIVLNRKWWESICKHMKDEKIGAVGGLGLTSSFVLTVFRHVLLLRGFKNQRGFTSNTLIRKKAVEGIVLTTDGRLEDMELQEKIIAKGYEWKLCLAYCEHTKKPSGVIKDSFGDFVKLAKKRGIIKAIMSI